MARRPKPERIASVTWRDGVHLGGTPIWCDARRRRDVCFVSAADRVGRTGHGQLIGTPLTLALLGAQPGQLAVPVRQRFTLGTLRLELVPSGRGPGAAALWVDNAGHRLLYAGAIRTHAAAGIEGGEVRTCDAVVVAAPQSDRLPAHQGGLPPLADVVAQTIEWTRAQLAADRQPVLLVDGMLDGLEVAACLHAAGIAVAATQTIREAARRAAPIAFRDLVIAAPSKRPGSGRAIIWLDSDRNGLTKLGSVTTALVSIRAHGPGPRTDAAFAWASTADRTQLLAWIESTAAREVYVTGADAEGATGAMSIVAALGPRARLLGPPRQMTLFPREAVP